MLLQAPLQTHGELKTKNVEVFDRIPVKVIYDARDNLTRVMAKIFDEIYKKNLSQSN